MPSGTEIIQFERLPGHRHHRHMQDSQNSPKAYGDAFPGREKRTVNEVERTLRPLLPPPPQGRGGDPHVAVRWGGT